MLQVTEQPHAGGSPHPAAPRHGSRGTKGRQAAEITDHWLLTGLRAVRRVKPGWFNWDVRRMTNGKNLENKEQEKGTQGGTSRVFESTLSMQ